MHLSHMAVDSPAGKLRLVASETALVALLWEEGDPDRVRLGEHHHHPDHPVLLETVGQLREYFAGTRKQFSLPLAMRGTAFQREVWTALLTIPFGETRSYGQLARQLEKPAATRAVGAANGANPLSIIVPCHRVVGASGKLTGFAGGLRAKAYLLGLESPEQKLFC